ncbi:hypothetical protein HK405_001610 [Cladochytrium tenue]|nr:hypothetical protein HK405_001610 [Cladochytrium tenue]
MPAVPVPALQAKLQIAYSNATWSTSPSKQQPHQQQFPDYSVMIFQPGDRSAFQIVGWKKSQSKDSDPGDGNSNDTDPMARDTSVINLFDVELGSHFAAGGRHPTLRHAAAVLHGAFRVPGRAQFISVAKAAIPHPTFAVQSYVADGEDVAYYSSALVVDGATTGDPAPASLDLLTEARCNESSHCGCFSSASRSDPAFWSCATAVGPPSTFWTWKLPGNSHIKKFAFTSLGDFIYSRQMDTSRFRIIPKPVDMISSEMTASRVFTLGRQHSIAGPTNGPMGTTLTLLELHSEPGSRVVLDIRYDTIDDDTFDFYLRIVYKKTAIAATNRNSTVAAFVFKGSVYTFDHVGPSKDLPHGYLFSRRRVAGLESRELRVRGALLDDSGLHLACVMEGDSVLHFYRYPRGHREEDMIVPAGLTSGPFLFDIPYEVNFVFDGAVRRFPSGSSGGGAPAAFHPATRGPWIVRSVWDARLVGEQSVLTASISSLAFVPPPSQDSPERSGRQTGSPRPPLAPLIGTIADSQGVPPPPILALLWDNGAVHILNLSARHEGSFFLVFVLIVLGEYFVAAMEGGKDGGEDHDVPPAAVTAPMGTDLQQGSLPAPSQLAAHQLDRPLGTAADPGDQFRQPDRHDAFRTTQADPADVTVAANIPAAAGMYDPVPVFRPHRLHTDTTTPLTPSSSTAADHHNHPSNHHHHHHLPHQPRFPAAFPGSHPHHRLHGTASHQHVNRSSSSTSISSTGSSPRRSRPSTGLLARHPSLPSSAAGPQQKHPPGRAPLPPGSSPRRPSVASSVVSSSSRGSDAAAAAAAAAASASGAGGLVARRPKVSQACVYCRRSHMTCDEGRPCQRCIRRRIAHLCHDEAKLPPAGPQPPSTSSASPTVAALTVAAAAADGDTRSRHASASVAAPPTAPYAATAVSTVAAPAAPAAVARTPSNAPSSAASAATAAPLSLSALWALPDTFATHHMGAEFGVIHDFLASLENELSDGAGSGGPTAGPAAPEAAAQQQQQQAGAVGLSSTERFVLTASDPTGEAFTDRLDQVMTAKFEAGLLRPYNYVSSYGRLQRWMEAHMSAASRRRVLSVMGLFRPRFRWVAQGLTDLDLVLVEEAFERLCLEYDRVFACMGVPAALWRRTGELWRCNKEFARLVRVADPARLRDGRTCIYELMSEDSAVGYWEKYGNIAFDPSQKAVLTSCVLRCPDDDPAAAASGGSGNTGIPCCFSFTIRRDRYNIPLVIAGNFLPAGELPSLAT